MSSLLQTNITNLQELLERANSLPEEIVLPTLSNPATSSDMLLGRQLIDADCNVVTGTIPSQGAQTITPSSVQQTAISAGTYASGTVTVAAIPSDYKQIQIVSNQTFTTNTSGRATIELGFKPDIVTLTFNEAYYDSDTRYTYQLDTSVDFYHGGSDHISASTWYGYDYVIDFYVDRTDSGFEILVWKYNSDLSSASGFRRATVTYSAIKFS